MGRKAIPYRKLKPHGLSDNAWAEIVYAWENGLSDREASFRACRDGDTYITEAELKPGDVIFFSGTIEGESGITHCGLYVGNNRMIHCGNPCTYADLTDAYWQEHFAGYGRFY